jgi:AAA domain
VRCASDVKMTPVSWLWPGKIAKGKLSLLAGEPGLGKSQAALSIAAAVSAGSVLPTGERTPKGSVIVLSSEDTPEDTMVPRLKAVGAELDKIHILSMVRETKAGFESHRSFNLQADLPVLERMVEKLGDVALIIVDPMASYLGKKVDSHRNTDVRAVLEPVAGLAARHGVAILGITHFSKGADTSAINRFIGSIAFIAAARSAFVVTKDPDSDDDDRRLFLPVKNNLARLGDGLALRVEQTILNVDGVDILTSLVRWLGEEVKQSANEVLAELADRRDTAVAAAEDFLIDYLAQGEQRVTDIREAARGHGHSWRTVERAKQKLGIEAVNDPEGPADSETPPPPCWWWRLPADWGAR